jgi:5'-nucleotidase
MSTQPEIAPAPPPETPAPWLLPAEVVALVDHPLRHEIPLHRQLFVNRNARMSEVEIIGFDMDYTLATYRMRKIEELSFEMTVERLCDVYGYPAELRALRYDHDFVIRGLVVDKAHGNIFKMDRFNHVGRCYHGRKPLPDSARKQLYRDVKIRVAAPRFAWIDTLFALPEAALYAQIIEVKEAAGEKPDYERLYDDIRRAIDEVHRDGSLKTRILADIEGFVWQDPELGPALHKFRSSGKKLFILTNSLFDYTDALMGYVLNGRLPEYPSWRNYFDLVIVGSRKPGFFSEREPFFELDAAGNPAQAAQSLERGKAYQGGNLADFERLVGIGGERILYVGDHIYGDILRSKKSSLWRTCLIIEELEAELRYTEAHTAEIRQLSEMEVWRARLDDELNQRKLGLNLLDKKLAKQPDGAAAPAKEIEAQRKRQKSELEKLRRGLRDLNREIERIAQEVEGGRNPYWGFLFKEGNENSRLGEQVEDYACLYTSRVSNFLPYSPMQYFHAPRAAMAHERGTYKLAPLGSDRR